MDLNLTGRHALVCGASEVIGRATAHELALLGADVTVLARRAEALQAVVAALPCSGAQQQIHLLGTPSHQLLCSDRAAPPALRPRNGCATIPPSLSHHTKFASRTFQNNNRRSRQAA